MKFRTLLKVQEPHKVKKSQLIKYGVPELVEGHKNMNITILKFIELLKISFPEKFPANNTNILNYAHTRGWIEDQDERFCNNDLNRQTAARIIHQFMKIELGVPDLQDISAAKILADLYTCHTCVNHIAQVYLRGIMDAQFVERDGVEYKIFNHLEFVLEEEVACIIEKIKAGVAGGV